MVELFNFIGKTVMVGNSIGVIIPKRYVDTFLGKSKMYMITFSEIPEANNNKEDSKGWL